MYTGYSVHSVLNCQLKGWYTIVFFKKEHILCIKKHIPSWNEKQSFGGIQKPPEDVPVPQPILVRLFFFLSSSPVKRSVLSINASYCYIILLLMFTWKFLVNEHQLSYGYITEMLVNFPLQENIGVYIMS